MCVLWKHAGQLADDTKAGGTRETPVMVHCFRLQRSGGGREEIELIILEAMMWLSQQSTRHANLTDNLSSIPITHVR